MASLDIDSLFTNIPLDETIDIVLTACKMATRISLTSQSMIFMICFTSPPKNHFTSNNKYHKQIDGVTMGSSMGPALANIFMISNNFNDFKPVLHRRYVFLLPIMQINLRGICHLNISTKIFL